jgi:RNA polymerase sigma factor (sigma-70 family)
VDADEIVVRRVLAGDRAAFGELIDRHRGAALRIARRIVPRSYQAEDVVQDALLQAFLSLDRLREPARFSGWLLGIVVNLARSCRRRPAAYSLDDLGGGRTTHISGLLDPMPSPAVVQETLEMHRLVDEAIAALPVEHRTAVQLHYVEGLKLWEIASLLGTPLGTVKARLHRARAQLRQSLIDTMVATGAPRPGAKEARMVEVTLEDVVVRVPRHEEVWWMTEQKDDKIGLGLRVLLLRERAGDRVLPIWVGPIEGDLIALRLVDLATVRPMTTDLLVRLLEAGTMELERVTVHTLRDNLFIGSLSIRAGNTTHEIDARPSDAITLALDVGAPIFVAEDVFESPQAYVLRVGDELTALEAKHQRDVTDGKAAPEPAAREWRSLRSLPRREHKHIRPRVR